jgi:hypothetical protein
MAKHNKSGLMPLGESLTTKPPSLLGRLFQGVANLLSAALGVLLGMLKTAVVWAASLAQAVIKGLFFGSLAVLESVGWLAARLAQGPQGMVEVAKVIDPWLRAFWPIVAMVIAGTTVFETAVRRSIDSTPHPELVYTIFTVAAAAAILSGAALVRYLREEQLATELLMLPAHERQPIMRSHQEGDFHTLLNQAAAPISPHLGEHRELVETELLACEEKALNRLNLPGYLGGALIGIGLVGTFIGLLAALADLAGVFSALMGGNVAAAASDPMALFSGMLAKLQEPMKGMATAFVASLYGLMGSLVMGLVVYSVRKSGLQAIARMRDLVRDHDRHIARALQRQAPAEADAATLNESLQVLNKHQEVLQLLLADLIRQSKADKDQPADR